MEPALFWHFDILILFTASCCYSGRTYQNMIFLFLEKIICCRNWIDFEICRMLLAIAMHYVCICHLISPPKKLYIPKHAYIFTNKCCMCWPICKWSDNINNPLCCKILNGSPVHGKPFIIPTTALSYMCLIEPKHIDLHVWANPSMYLTGWAEHFHTHWLFFPSCLLNPKQLCCRVY